MNSSEPGDARFNTAAISAIFGLIPGQIFDPRTTIEIFPVREILLVLNILIARQHNLITLGFGVADQFAVRDLPPALVFGSFHLVVCQVALQ